MGAQEGTRLGCRMKRCPHKHWHSKKWGTSLGEIFPPSISILSHEGQQEPGHRTHQPPTALRMRAADRVPGLAGLPAEARAAAHPCGMQPLVSGVNSSPRV